MVLLNISRVDLCPGNNMGSFKFSHVKREQNNIEKGLKIQL